MLSLVGLTGLGLSVLAACTHTAGDHHGPPESALRVENGRIVDGRGASVILRGVGVNQLGDFYEAFPGVPPVFPLTEQDFDRMAMLGLNSIRLVVSWSLLEPSPGSFDREYVTRIREAVGWARERGIMVILDMHQDAWGKYIATERGERCAPPFMPNVGWDGAPAWATLSDGRSTCTLLQRELSPAAYQAWQSFWDDRDGIQQHLIDTWARLAAEFRDDPTVIGYDLLNEPNWGQDYRRVVERLQPAFRARCLEAIRSAELPGRHKLVFFEPLATWSFFPSEPVVPFTEDRDIVYGPHIYNSINGIAGAEVATVEGAFRNARAEADGYGAGLWIGEWHGGDLEHALRIAAEEDRLQVGSARWVWRVSCGDPHFAVSCQPDCTLPSPTIHPHVRVTECGDPGRPEGVDRSYHATDVIVLARPYPQAFPQPATYRTRPLDGVLEMGGTAPGDVPLTLWIPGAGEPEVESEGVRGTSLRQVPGGWIFDGTPAPGPWTLTARARGPFLR